MAGSARPSTTRVMLRSAAQQRVSKHAPGLQHRWRASRRRFAPPQHDEGGKGCTMTLDSSCFYSYIVPTPLRRGSRVRTGHVRRRGGGPATGARWHPARAADALQRRGVPRRQDPDPRPLRAGRSGAARFFGVPQARARATPDEEPKSGYADEPARAARDAGRDLAHHHHAFPRPENRRPAPLGGSGSLFEEARDDRPRTGEGRRVRE